MSEADFENRTVLVTGGSRDIGRACCQRLARAGARVAINFRSLGEDALQNARLVATAAHRTQRADAHSLPALSGKTRRALLRRNHTGCLQSGRNRRSRQAALTSDTVLAARKMKA